MEGYYGKLLSWSDRQDLLNALQSHRMNTYCYAPKEDIQHRLRWRESNNKEWHRSFKQFCQSANARGISVAAGIAPGLDFIFNDQDSDFSTLLHKAQEFITDGANEILILWDDIDEDIIVDRNGLSEGAAHANVVNRLSETLGRHLWTVPRVYASEIENRNNYLEDFFTALEPQHTVLLCGNAIVASTVALGDLKTLSRTATTAASDEQCNPGGLKHRTVVWDNFYANDYCPRRLFLGAWTGRETIEQYLINPTGLPLTDHLLLDVVASTHTTEDRQTHWSQALKRHGVPDAFFSIASFFSRPFFGDRAVVGNAHDIDCPPPSKEIEDAIETCLWQWKSPLAREWYPFIFGLKHDLALLQQRLPSDRILKTQPPALANTLLKLNCTDTTHDNLPTNE